MNNSHELAIEHSAYSLGQKLEELHDNILERFPGIDRIACALYDAETDMLKTFINSTRSGHAIAGYEYPLQKSEWLSELAKHRKCRVIDDISEVIHTDTAHSAWLLEQGYFSSLTIPMMSGANLIGFVFFDSTEKHYFNERTERDLLLFSNMISMTIALEISAVRSLLATAQAAREFAQMRDFETGTHLTRMAQISRIIARGVAEVYQLSDEKIEHIYLFAPLHDIGKIGIPDSILLKRGRLTPEEYEVMKSHVEKGVEIITNVLEDYELSYMADSQVMINIVAAHHEKLDGSGYPKGLKAEQIPIEARIVCVADIFDALASSRPYKEAWSVEESLNELDRLVGDGKIDGPCVEALKQNIQAASEILSKYVD